MRRQAAQMRDKDTGNVVDGLVEIRPPPRQLALLLLSGAVAASRSWLRRAWHQPPCAAIAASRAAGIAGTKRALIEREAHHLRLDHTFGFELARVQSRCGANADALTVGGFLVRGRGMILATGAMVASSAVIPVASRQDTPISASE
jgi:hypothetical protein